MKFITLTILLGCISCFSLHAQVIPGMPDLPKIPAEFDGPETNAVVQSVEGQFIPPEFPGGSDSLVVYFKRRITLSAIKSNTKKLYALIIGFDVDSIGNTRLKNSRWDSREEWPEMKKMVDTAINTMPRLIPMLSSDRVTSYSSYEAWEFFFHNNHLVIEMNAKYLKIF